MKHYKDKKGNMYAFELDGSQDHLIPKNYIEIDSDEVKTISDNHAQKIMEKMDKLDPVTKLSNFLQANPDVAKLIASVDK
jgi:hypothetical protein